MAGSCLRRESDDDLAIRINELATKATQLLQFLSLRHLSAIFLMNVFSGTHPCRTGGDGWCSAQVRSRSSAGQRDCPHSVR
jgi:hypothetical protein